MDGRKIEALKNIVKGHNPKVIIFIAERNDIIRLKSNMKVAMKRIFVGFTIVAIMAAVFAHADVDLGFRSNTKNPALTPGPIISKSSDFDDHPTPRSSINSTSKGIQLHFRDYPLGEILKNIHDETGIRFNLSSQMANSPISIDIEAKNWKSSVRKLITGFSRIEVWTNHSKSSRIWLMESAHNN